MESDRGEVFESFKDACVYLADHPGTKMYDVAERPELVVAKSYHQAKLTYIEKGPFTVRRMDAREVGRRTLEALKELTRETTAFSGQGGTAAGVSTGGGDGKPGTAGKA